MRFWDTSAIAPIFINEESSPLAKKYIQEDPHIIIWWGTPIEVFSAISRLEREGEISYQESQNFLTGFETLRSKGREILPLELVRKTAERLVRTHSIKTLDALQLSSCIVANVNNQIEMVCFDERLCRIARIEGIVVLSND